MKELETYSVGVYCRLSDEDRKSGMEFSDSIEDQKEMLRIQVEDVKKWNVYDYYIDDDVTGTTFDRDGFNRMMRDVDRGRINCVITKTLSRFGRNYIEAGRHRELLHERGVRYIALHDNHDSLLVGRFDLSTSIKEVINEMHCADVSREVRRTKRLRGEQGKFANSQAPYGYMKAPNDRHQLVVDVAAASIVQRIFQEYADFGSGRDIAVRLTAESVDSPSYHHYKNSPPLKKNGKPRKSPKGDNVWNSETVMKLLRQRAYIGDMVSCTRENVSYKNKKRKILPPEEWVIVEGTHESLVPRDLWDKVQGMINAKHRVYTNKQTGKPGIFAGILKCADCGGQLSYESAKGAYRCSAYLNKGKEVCSSHRISESDVMEYVLNDVKTYAVLSANERSSLSKRLLSAMRNAQDKEVGAVGDKIKAHESRLKVIEATIDELYEDKAMKQITAAEYMKRKSRYEQEQTRIEDELPRLRREYDQIKEATGEIEEWLDLIESCIGLETLDRETATGLVKNITVSERVKQDGKTTQNIEINYRFIGNLLNAKEDAAS